MYRFNPLTAPNSQPLQARAYHLEDMDAPGAPYPKQTAGNPDDNDGFATLDRQDRTQEVSNLGRCLPPLHGQLARNVLS